MSFFENKKKRPDFAKVMFPILEKSVLFVWIWRLISHLKFSFKSILDKKHQFFALRSFSILCHTRNSYRTVSIPRNLPCPKKLLATRLRLITLAAFGEALLPIFWPKLAKPKLSIMGWYVISSWINFVFTC